MGKKFWTMRAAKDNDKIGEILLYGYISSETWWGDEVTPKQFKKDLDALGDITELHVFINSGGGDVFAGQAIHNMLKRHKAKVVAYIDGLAASIASVVAEAAEVVIMPKNAMMMIHNAWTWGAGNAEEFRKLADDMDKIDETIINVYMEKTGLDRDKIVELMKAETWMTAEEAVEMGFADQLEEEKQVAASLKGMMLTVNGQQTDLSKFRNIPQMLKAFPTDEMPKAEPKTEEHKPQEEQQSHDGLLSLYAHRIQVNKNRSRR